MNLELAENELSARNRRGRAKLKKAAGLLPPVALFRAAKKVRKKFVGPKRSSMGRIQKHATQTIVRSTPETIFSPEETEVMDISYLPDPEQPDVLVREDAFDGMEEDEFFNYLSEMSPEMSMEEYDQLSASRKERKAQKKELKMQKKAAKVDKKQAKADLKRAKGEAKIIKAQRGPKTSFTDVVGGIKDVVGSVSGAVKDIKGGGEGDAAAMDVPESTGGEKIMGMPKNAVLIGSGVLALGLIYMLTKGKKK